MFEPASGTQRELEELEEAGGTTQVAHTAITNFEERPFTPSRIYAAAK